MNKSTLHTSIDICYVISHGFAARMVLQTGLIERLTKAGKSVSIICPDATDENFEVLTKNPLVSIHDADIKQTIWDDDYGVKRRYYLEDIRSNPVFWEKHIYSILYTKSIHPWKRIRPFIYYLVYLLIPYFPFIRENFKRKESTYLVSQKATALLQQLQPKIVVSTYPVNYLEAKFLYAAKEENITTIIHLLSWDNVTTKGIFPVIPDRFIAWGKVMDQELKDYYGLYDEQVDICGVAHFDQHIEVKDTTNYKAVISSLNLDPEKPYLFIAMSAPRFAPCEIDIVEWIAAAINNNVFGKTMQLVVRPHPQNVQGVFGDNTWLKRLDRLTSNRVAIDYPQLINSKIRWSMRKSDMLRLSNLLAGCSVCLNSGSTVSIDALVMDKPVILTSFDGDKELYYWKSAKRLISYFHLKKLIDLGGANVVHNYEELKNELHKYISEPNHDLAKRQHALQMECHANDGKATDRVVEAMVAALAKIEAVYV